MDLSSPFLRSPPFPGFTSYQISVSSRCDDIAETCRASDDIFDRITACRVGGFFWGPRFGGFSIVARKGVALAPDILASTPQHDIAVVALVDDSFVNRDEIPHQCDPWSLIEAAKSVHAPADDELSIIAGLIGIPVFGPDGQRIDPVVLRANAKNALSLATYRNCFSNEPAPLEDVVTLLGDWRRQIDRNQGLAAASGIAFWKRDALRRFLWDGQRTPPLLGPAQALRRARRVGQGMAIWPSRVSASIVAEAASHNVPVIRIEDGFLRSSGLGAGLHPPGSIVVDRTGLYYDARSESDLERLLSTHAFSAALTARACKLRQRLCAVGVTKYGRDAGKPIDLPPGRRTILAVGQVDDDLSVRLGGGGIKGNLDFLERVRRAEPEAWIIYRPHPDVQAGHRQGHLSDATILNHADAIDRGAPLMALVQAVDCVHVMSSLTGFEALMRDRPVTVHGMPFYAGWGLTRDLAQSTGRRKRTLTVDQLVAGTLILYPHYIDPVTMLPCGPELMVERMAVGATARTTWLIRLRALQGKLRRFMTLSAEFIRG